MNVATQVPLVPRTLKCQGPRKFRQDGHRADPSPPQRRTEATPETRPAQKIPAPSSADDVLLNSEEAAGKELLHHINSQLILEEFVLVYHDFIKL